MDLTKKHCVPCEGKVHPLGGPSLGEYLSRINEDWQLADDERRISREFQFKDFNEAINFVNKAADVAEEEGHHPDIHIYFNRVVMELWTHAVKGLTENDFILAGKIDGLVLSSKY